MCSPRYKVALYIKRLFAYVILLSVVMILVNIQTEIVLVCQHLVDVIMILHKCLKPYQTNTFIEYKDQITLFISVKIKFMRVECTNALPILKIGFISAY